MRVRAAFFLFTLIAATLHAKPARDSTERFNIISIVTDDQADWSIGAYGNRDSRTPNMDRLAREGALFRNAFVNTPVCSPSRVAFLTGLYGSQVGITDWIDPNEAKAGLGLPTNAITWPKILQRHGYITALVGKWHLGIQPQFHPTKHGFDHFFGFLAGGMTPMNPTLEANGQTREFKGAVSDLLMDDALEFVQVNRTRPFALLIHFREPHLPYTPMPEEDSAPFKNLDPTIPPSSPKDAVKIKQWTREYYAAIHAIDRNLGRLLNKLDELNLTRKTIILFTSDHGYMIGHHGLHTKGNASWISGPNQGKKRPNMFEESIRVPLIIRWPGVVKPKTEIHQTVSNIDTLPTILSMLNVSIPKNLKQNGVDFSPLLRGKKIEPHKELFGQYDLHNGGLAYMRMVRTDEWKLVRHYESISLDELYDLENDPGETKNLYDDPSRKKIREQLQLRLTKWQRSIDDPLLSKIAVDDIEKK